ncbi:MAG: DUF4248 domain-containing protein [Prevotella sp.]|nr:DUF4248 domain-containing protein [Prevotella sp.]
MKQSSAETNNNSYSYTRRSLAMAYFPELTPKQAVRRLTMWIRRCSELHEKLNAKDRKFSSKRILTVREAKLIMEYLGEP